MAYRVSDTTQLLSPGQDEKHEEDPNFIKPRKKSASSHFLGIFLLSLGVLIAIAAFIFIWYIQNQASTAIADRYVPSPGSSQYDSWIRNDAPKSAKEYLIYTLYNVTNVHDVLYNGAIAHVEEIGPFVYQSHTQLVELNFSTPGEVHYKKWNQQTLVRDPVSFPEPDGTISTYTSLDPYTTRVTMINPVPWGAAWQLIYDPFFTVRNAVDGLWPCDPRVEEHLLALNGSFFQCVQNLLATESGAHGEWKYMLEDAGPEYGLFATRTASQWLGVEPGTALNSTVLQAVNKLQFAKIKNFDADARWAWFFNSTQADTELAERDLEYEAVYFDRDDLSKAQNLIEWNGMETIYGLKEFEKTRKPNIVNYDKTFVGWGEDLPIRGSGFYTSRFSKPHPSCDDQFTFWLAAGGRPVDFECTGTNMVKGVKALELRVASSNFAASPYNRDMFFSTIEGFGNETQFRSYGPVFASTPHFHGYPNLKAQFPVVGMVDRGTLDETFIHVETESGLVIDAAERLQINVMTPFLGTNGTLAHFWDGKPYRMDSGCLCLPELNYNIAGGNIIPALHFEKRSTLTDEDADDLKKLQRAYVMVYWIRIGGYALAGLLLIIGGFRLYKTCSVQGQIDIEERITHKGYGT